MIGRTKSQNIGLNKMTENLQKNTEKIAKKSTKIAKKGQKAATKDFKKQYFDYYDDIKSPTHKIVDW